MSADGGIAMAKTTEVKLIAIMIGVILVVAMGLLAYFVGIPMYKSIQEARHRRQATENFKKIGIAIHNYGQAQRVFPPSTLPPPAVDPTNLPFETYSGYFVSNQFEPNAAESFVVISDQEQFDKVFGVAMVMRDKSHRLPKELFKENLILAAIKRGKAVWEFKVENVPVSNGVAELRYTATSKASDSATFASPLIVSIPRGKYTVVRFRENEKVVKEAKLLPR
jgi:hypothetical protein